MTTLLKIDIVCPVCETRFSSRTIGSMGRTGQDTDFRPQTAGEDPLPYYVHVCPQCCFAAFAGDFGAAEPDVKRFVLDGGVMAHEDTAPRGALAGSTKYLLAALCYEHDSRATHMRMADLYLRAAWCARAERRPDREHECQVQAALRFEAALDVGEAEGEQEQTITYLIGELYRRLGCFELAETMLQRATEYAEVQRDERVTSLAGRQKRAALLHRSENMAIDL